MKFVKTAATTMLPLFLWLASCTGSVSDSSSEPRSMGERPEPGDKDDPPSDELPETPAFPGGPSVASCESGRGRGAATEVVRRLTHDEYAASVREALSLTEVNTSLLPADSVGSAYPNTAGFLTPSANLVAAYDEFAQEVASAVAARDPWLGLGACKAADKACQQKFVKDIGARLFRRPLTGEETEAFAGLFATSEAEGVSPAEAVGFVLQALVVAPQALYRLEKEAATKVTPQELAVRLSFLLRGAGPDKELAAAAAEGSLSEAKLEAQVKRLVPGAQTPIATFGLTWAGLQGLPALVANGSISESLARDMEAETRQSLLKTWIDDAAPVAAFLRTNSTNVSAALAKHAGLPTPDKNGRVDLGGNESRLGLLTQPGYVAANSGTGDMIVHRGISIFRKMLCGSIPDPPADALMVEVKTQVPGERAKSEARMAMPRCGTCHSAFDTLAYALEPYDRVGRVRKEDEHGVAVKSDGVLPNVSGTGTTPFANVRELSDLLMADPRVSSCVVRGLVQYAWGRVLNDGDECDIAEITVDAEKRGGTLQATLTAIAVHPSFSRALQ
ncbi:MAG: DUF1588 domain-containing protein [Deltaproteobacteria bacterium]|nr:DUF1588 domain-containing protein [Deltaproteobacteria bacterium]